MGPDDEELYGPETPGPVGDLFGAGVPWVLYEEESLLPLDGDAVHEPEHERLELSEDPEAQEEIRSLRRLDRSRGK